MPTPQSLKSSNRHPLKIIRPSSQYGGKTKEPEACTSRFDNPSEVQAALYPQKYSMEALKATSSNNERKSYCNNDYSMYVRSDRVDKDIRDETAFSSQIPCSVTNITSRSSRPKSASASRVANSIASAKRITPKYWKDCLLKDNGKPQPQAQRRNPRSRHATELWLDEALHQSINPYAFPN